MALLGYSNLPVSFKGLGQRTDLQLHYILSVLGPRSPHSQLIENTTNYSSYAAVALSLTSPYATTLSAGNLALFFVLHMVEVGVSTVS
jgi:hypothetical protein